MAAIKVGILTQTTKSELGKAEAENREIERELAHNPGMDKVVSFLPRAADHYKQFVNDIREYSSARGSTGQGAVETAFV